jgi:Ca-activated chloride channel family protein
MTFLWPHHLWLLLALPLLPALYLWLLRRRGQPALRVSSVHIARQAAGPTWRRHVPPAIVGLALALLVLSLARPSARLTLPWASATVMLAIDVSLSMRVHDVLPTRMVAAQEAARTFLREAPPELRVGIVTFAGSAQVAQQATLDRPSLVGAVDAIQMQYGTAIGSAIVVCLAELFPEHKLDVGEMTYGAAPKKRGWGEAKPAPAPAFTPVAPGSYDAAAIILLSDGRRTTGIDTLQAAKMAADRGVRIYAVGLGTVDGHVATGEGSSIYLQLDEPTLREVARSTGGEYFHAGTAEALRSVYQHLGTRLQMQARDTELTGALALAAAMLMVVGASLSLLWFGRVA